MALLRWLDFSPEEGPRRAASTDFAFAGDRLLPDRGASRRLRLLVACALPPGTIGADAAHERLGRADETHAGLWFVGSDS
jgi:hypothetical protein